VAVARTRRLLDLDADPVAVGAVLGRDPLLADAVMASPGRRMPGTVAPFELAVRAVVGQQVSLASARAVCGRLASAHGSPLGLEPVSAAGAAAGPHFLFPRPDMLAQADPGTLPLPGRRAATVVALAGAVADGRLGLDPGADRDETERRLLELPGIGPWTASYIRMRALGDPDVFLPADLVLDRFLAAGPARGRSAPAGPLEWKPWRSYAVAHLWAAARPELGGPPTGRGEDSSRDDTRGEG
jgi:AraC family transcriptional regulator of adaptative response / DNA-3-methyladenine glycosylase II